MTLNRPVHLEKILGVDFGDTASAEAYYTNVEQSFEIVVKIGY